VTGKPKTGSFRHRIYWYIVITAVVQLLLGILYAITSHAPGPLFLLFFIAMVNFAMLLFQPNISWTLYPTAIIVGTFFMFLMIAAIGEIHHQIGKSIPSDPLEEARRHESHE
jgi:K+-sensing histidine kinase KdpD